MQWTSGQPIVRSSFLDRLRLRRTAVRYAGHGWTVLPGAWLTGSRFTCGRPGCPIMSCHPAAESWEDEASADTARVARWWRRRPHSVLLATGWTFDVIEVPGTAGLRALGQARLRAGFGADTGGGPVAVTPAGRWMFLVRPGLPLRPELESCLDVVRHGRGSWVPAAPSPMPDGPVRWAVTPESVDWRLPDPEAVQELLVRALGRRCVPRPAVVPRQTSTRRRAA